MPGERESDGSQCNGGRLPSYAFTPFRAAASFLVKIALLGFTMLVVCVIQLLLCTRYTPSPLSEMQGTH